jgi:septal ring factor EnvC (AmiA/AmiB activator)
MTAEHPPQTGEHPLTADERLSKLERRLAVRSLALGGAVVLALAAGIVGVVLALGAKDESATKAEVRSLRDQVEEVQREAAQATEENVTTITDRLDALEGRVNTIAGSQRTTQSEIEVLQDDIDELRSQVSDLESAPPASNATGEGNAADSG